MHDFTTDSGTSPPPDPSHISFARWLREMDVPTANWLDRDETLSPAENEAFIRGRRYGEWLSAFEMAALLDRIGDAETVVTAYVAGLLALWERRSALDLKLALQRAKRTTNEHDGGGTDGSVRT